MNDLPGRDRSMRTHKTLIVCLAGIVACGDADSRTSSTAAPPDFVALDSAQQRSAGLRIDSVGGLPADTILVTGTVTFDASRVSHIGPRMGGRIRGALREVGNAVRTGDTLAILDSPELGAVQARWAQARVTRDLAARAADRAVRLFRDGIISERRRLEVDGELAARDVELASARQALLALGASPDTSAKGVFVLRAPLNGEVVEKHAVAGEVVGPESNLFIVGELATVWLILDLYETDLARVRQGLSARVVADAYPDRPFKAQVGLVSSMVDSVSRTVKVRVEIDNSAHELKPGMFARAGIAVDARSGAIGIPHRALQRLDGADVVFVPTADGQFRVRRVVVGKPRAGGWVEVLKGLSRGERVVTDGSFALKAQLQSGAGGGVE